MQVGTVFDGIVSVSYMQMYLDSRPAYESTTIDHRAGQQNGLCGAAEPGYLFLTTGMHTGCVGLAIEVHEAEPVVDEGWEDVVEVPFVPASRTAWLVQWEGDTACEFHLRPVPYRVRYCATGMDEGNASGVVFRGDPPVDRYLLQFWPAPFAPDCIVKQTSRQAAYWHEHAQRLPPPPTPEEKAEAARLAHEEAERARAETIRRSELRAWGGQEPTERLRRVRGNVHGLRSRDVYLVHALGAASDGTLRAIAAWAARRAADRAGLVDADWIAAALDALDAGRPLPGLFGDPAALWARIEEDPQITRTTFMLTLPSGETVRACQQAMAFGALAAAAEPDALQAAIDGLHAAMTAFGDDDRELLDDVRRAHPILGHVPAPPPEGLSPFPFFT
jgi:hypothetical protein